MYKSRTKIIFRNTEIPAVNKLSRFVNKFSVQGKVKIAETDEDFPENVLLDSEKLLFIVHKGIHPV